LENRCELSDDIDRRNGRFGLNPQHGRSSQARRDGKGLSSDVTLSAERSQALAESEVQRIFPSANHAARYHVAERDIHFMQKSVELVAYVDNPGEPYYEAFVQTAPENK
jgi:uncharacterized caspase-like protein